MIRAVLYMGQSNVSGVETTGLPSGVPLASVRYWIRGISGGTTDVAWHDLQQWPDAATAFGPALSMGVELNKIWPTKVAILQINRGGSTIAEWQPGQFYYETAVTTINAAKALLLAQFPGETQVHWDFVWQQGESDVDDQTAATNWGASYTNIKAGLESVLGQALRRIIIATNSAIGGVYATTLRASQTSVADQLVIADGLTMVDSLHFNSASNNTVGVRTAAAIFADYLEVSSMISHGTATRTAVADTVVDRIDAGSGAGKIVVRQGATVLATVTLADPAFGGATNGVATLLGVPLNVASVASGTPDNFLAQDSDSNTVFAGSVTATGGGGDLTLDKATIASPEVVTITAGTYTAPT